MNSFSYGWKDTQATCAHSYLVPEVLRRVDRLGCGRPCRIVDMGCGNGYLAGVLAKDGHDVVAFDASADGVALAGERHPRVRFSVASVYDDDLAARITTNADCAIALEVVEHLYFPRKLFGAARQLLRKDGTLIVSTPYHGYLKNLALSVANGWDRHFTVDWDGGHIKFFSNKTLTRMAESEGFDVRLVSGAGRLPGLWKSTVLLARAR